jgi:hypothetical protein
VHCESRSDLLSTVEFEATLALLAHLPGYAQLHASGAVVDGGAVLALGPSGSGKSNLAMGWHRSGYRLLGDDAVLVGGNGRARGFARLMKLDLDRAGAYQIDAERTLAFDPTANEIWYDPCEGAGWATETWPERVVAWVRRRPGSALRVRQLDRAEGLNRMIGDLFGSGLMPAEAVPVLVQVAAEANSWRSSFRTPRMRLPSLPERHLPLRQSQSQGPRRHDRSHSRPSDRRARTRAGGT